MAMDHHDRAGGPMALSSNSARPSMDHHHHHHHSSLATPQQPHYHHHPQHHPPVPYDYAAGSGSASASGSGSNSPSSTLVRSQQASQDSGMSRRSADMLARQQAEVGSSSQHWQQSVPSDSSAGGPSASSSMHRISAVDYGRVPVPNGQGGAGINYSHPAMQQQLQQQQIQQYYAAQQPSGIPSASPSMMTVPHVRPPLRSRTFGLGRNLRPQEDLVDPAFFPGGIVPAEAVTLLGTGVDPKTKQWPNFSVELKAPTFDERGYPVYSGRAAGIKGEIRMRRSDTADVVIKISAHTTSGSAAAVWDGVALQPPESGTERAVFQTVEKVTFEEGRVEAPTPGLQPMEEADSGDAVHMIPFTLNLPVGGNTRMVDGNVETVAVALPPSFEMSSEQDAREKAVLRNTASAGTGSSGRGSGDGQGSGGGVPPGSGAASIKTSRTKMTALTLRDAVESGLQQVYRIGCFYRITFTLVRRKTSGDRSRKSSGSFLSKGKKSAKATSPSGSAGSTATAGKQGKGSDTISIPFVFLGEPTQLPPPPASLPPLRLSILSTPSVPLARGWESEVVTAKWSGMLLKALKRNVELELFFPAGKIIQAPSVIPVLLVIRPEDPELLPQPFSAASPVLGSPSRSHPGSPRLSSALSRTDDTAVGSDQQVRSPPYLQQRTASGNHVPTKSSLAQVSRASEDDEEQEQLDDGDGIGASPSQSNAGVSPSTSNQGNSLSRLIRSSLSITRPNNANDSATSSGTGAAAGRPSMDSAGGAPSSPQMSSSQQKPLKKKSSRPSFAFGRNRPSTAPSTTGSDESRTGTETSFTVRGGGGPGSSSGSSGSPVDLPALVRVSLLQNVFYSSSSVNETPKNKRRLVSVADLEEVDYAAIVSARGGAVEGTDVALQVEEAKRKGVRVLRGLLRVGREATPSFRVQGIELKYAIKVDLLPFNPRTKTRVNATPSSPPRTPPGRPSIHAAYAQRSSQAHQPNPSLSSSFTASNSLQWSPSKQGGQSVHYDPSLPSVPSSTLGGFAGASGIAASEAGWTKRSPSDQTVMAPEMAKLSKTVGALWINVRLVKGRGAI